MDHVGRLSTSSSGWTREVNIVSWNGAAPRLDIRDWSPDRMKMSRGVGLNREETENLRALLNGFDPRRAGI
ncbi:MAG: PC4/YdbC family ssDNA-binding protein [Bacillota bacterium]|nr:PC4/YdbC family ssDNA-binding protein [Bacillota bacterium]